MELVLNYTFFALVATAANIASQELIIQLYSGRFSVLLSVLFGTGVGLVTKYLLDKRYIFKFRTQSVTQDSALFVVYTLTGLITTGIFWGFEFAFHHIYGEKGMRYLGGVIGLGIGYVLKYQLDKRFVFVHRGSR